MALGDGIRRNIAYVEPSERELLRDALIELNKRFFPGTRTDSPPGGVTWWFKQDEIHHATPMHRGLEFLPWHREIVNRLEEMLRQINPQLSLHYWDWTQDPRAIPNANLGGGETTTLNLFIPRFMGYGGSSSAPIGEPWLSAGYYVPGAVNYRSTDHLDPVNNNPADPPREVVRSVSGSPASVDSDNAIVNAANYPTMRSLLESVHAGMQGFVNMGGDPHVVFRDPFVFLLLSNVDRLFARWQTDPAHPERLDPNAVYGSESGDARLNSDIRPWSGVPPTTRPWAPPENQQVTKNYKDLTVVTPPRYDTNEHAPKPGQLLSYGDDGTPGNVSTPVVVDLGEWRDFKFLFAGGNVAGENRIYAVGQNGQLLSYGDAGTPGKVSTPVVVGLGGWRDFKFLFSGRNVSGENRIYAVDQNGQLLSYGDAGTRGNVSTPVPVGLGGWRDFRFLFSGGNVSGENRIYAVVA